MAAKRTDKIKTVPLSDLMPDPANVRVHPERNQQTIRASLTRFGPGRSLVIDRNNIIRAGSGTFEQAAAAGIDEVLVVEPKRNQIVAVQRSDWSDTEGTGYSLVDNRSTDQSENDKEREAAVLESMRTEGFPLDALGYTGDEIDAMRDMQAGEIVPDFQPASIDDQGRLDEKAKITCPQCGHEFST
jgi:hypothetical protein